MRFNLAQHLTDNYKKDPGSNIAKLLGIVDDELNFLAYTLGMIERYRDIDRAKGLTLDRAGKNVLELRTSEDDEEYRRQIKVKIRANLSKGDLETIADVAEALLGDRFVRVGETWSDPKYNNEPAGVYIRVKSLDAGSGLRGDPIYLNGEYYLNGEILLNGGVEDYDPIADLEQIRKSIKRAVAGGVRLYWEIPEKAATEIGIVIEHSMTGNLKHKVVEPITIIQQIQISSAHRAVADDLPSRLDGTYSLTGQAKLDGLRERIVHKVSITEVVA